MFVIQVKLELQGTHLSLALCGLGQMFLYLPVFYQSQDGVICMPASEIKYVRQ